MGKKQSFLLNFQTVVYPKQKIIPFLDIKSLIKMLTFFSLLPRFGFGVLVVVVAPLPKPIPLHFSLLSTQQQRPFTLNFQKNLHALSINGDIIWNGCKGTSCFG